MGSVDEDHDPSAKGAVNSADAGHLPNFVGEGRLLVFAGPFRQFRAMTMAHLVLFFLACGAATFPLALIVIRYAASLSPASAFSQRIGRGFETAISLSLVIWIVGALVFYAIALHIERQKPCDDQHTNQLTEECRKLFGAKD
jgi:hypothetical protein